MIVKSESTLVQAMDLIKLGKVRYADHNSFRVVEDAETLETLLRNQLSNKDIGVVVLCGREAFMEDHDYEMKLVQRERRIQEQKDIRHWVTMHPAEAKKMMEKAERRESLVEA